MTTYKRPSYFVRQIVDRRSADKLTASALDPLEFRSADRKLIDLRIEGGLSGDLHVWSTSSTSGFVTMPVMDVAVLSIRFVTHGRLIR